MPQLHHPNNHARKAFFLLVVVGVLMLLGNATFAEDCTLKIRLRGLGPALEYYELTIFEYAIAATVNEYGPCKVEPILTPYPMARVWKEFNNGEKIQAGLSTGNSPPENKANLIEYHNRFLGDALGLRRSILRKNFKHTFDNIKTFEELQKYKVGQGYMWADAEIYEHMGIPVISSFRLKHVYGMLAEGRFDHIPLCILQVAPIFDVASEDYRDIALADKTYLYYPIKVVAYINNKDQRMAERLTLGLNRIFNNGVADKFFNDFFGDEIAKLIQPDSHIFVLENPSYSKEQNRTISRKFLRDHQLEKYAIYPVEQTPPK